MKIPFRRTLGLEIVAHGYGPRCTSFKLVSFSPVARIWSTLSTWRDPADVADGHADEKRLSEWGYEIDWTPEELDWLKKARETGELAAKAADLSKAIHGWFNAFGETP